MALQDFRVGDKQMALVWNAAKGLLRGHPHTYAWLAKRYEKKTKQNMKNGKPQTSRVCSEVANEQQLACLLALVY